MKTLISTLLLRQSRSLKSMQMLASALLGWAVLALGAPITVAAPFVYVPVENNVVVIDTTSNTVVGTPIPVANAFDIAIAPNGKYAYVTDVGIAGVSLIDIATNTVIGTPIPVQRSFELAITPNGKYLYVTQDRIGTVSVIDTNANTVIGNPIQVGRSTGIAITPDGTRAYVTNNSTAVTVIDIITNNIIGDPITIPVPGSSISITPDGKHAYVGGLGDNGPVIVIDTASNTVVTTISVPAFVNDLVITPNGKYAYIVMPNFGVVVIDTVYNTVVGTPLLIPNATSVVITPNGKYAYVTQGAVTDNGSGALLMLDTSTNTVAGTIPLTPYPVGFLAITPIAFPSTSTLDNFNRSNGKLGANWSGSATLDQYRIVNNQVNVLSGGPIYWNPTSFGTNQEAFVTLVKVNPSGFERGLMLKAQSGSNAINYQRGVINVDYRAQNHAVLVSTYQPNRGWKSYPKLTNITFNNGDQIGARVWENGAVQIYKNQVLIGTTTLDNSDQIFFKDKGGHIGLWFDNASGAIFDDFGGGNL